MHTMLLTLAQATTGGGADAGPLGACGGGGGMQSIVFMLLMFAVFWFILIRPQQKRAKEHQAFLTALKKGDEVVTRGGVIGRVSGVADNVVTLEVQEKVRVRVLKSYIEGRHAGSAPSTAAEKEPVKPAATTDASKS